MKHKCYAQLILFARFTVFRIIKKVSKPIHFLTTLAPTWCRPPFNYATYKNIFYAYQYCIYVSFTSGIYDNMSTRSVATVQ